MRINYWQKFIEGGYFHIYNRTVGHDFLFMNHENYRYFLEKWQLYLEKYIEVYAFCLMSNHFHFVVRVKMLDDKIRENISLEKTKAAQKFSKNLVDYNGFLEDQFKRFFSAYALAYNKEHKRHGNLFQSRFKRVQISDEVGLRNAICYVHHNPIHHDYSNSYDAWKFSSYKAYLSNNQTKIARNQGLTLFDKKNSSQEHFEKIHNQYRLHKENWRRKIDWDDDLSIDNVVV